MSWVPRTVKRTSTDPSTGKERTPNLVPSKRVVESRGGRPGGPLDTSVETRSKTRVYPLWFLPVPVLGLEANRENES